MSKYKSKWKPYRANKSFWNEVLKERVIKKIRWTEKGIKSFVLDSGEEIFIVIGSQTNVATLMIVD